MSVNLELKKKCRKKNQKFQVKKPTENLLRSTSTKLFSGSVGLKNQWQWKKNWNFQKKFACYEKKLMLRNQKKISNLYVL